VSHDRALLDSVAGRTLAIEDGRIVSYPGGWAELVRRREPTPAPPKPKAKERMPRKPARAPKPAPTPLELLEREIARAEQRVADLEQRLAEDWTDMDLLSAHRAARDDVAALLARWEMLFEEAQA